jgi:mono/diheme cytochrome c family protein
MVNHPSKKILRIKTIIISIVLLLNLSIFAQDGALTPAAAEGETLFKANCVSCHAMNSKQVGPALQGVHTRRSEEWLLKWIKNNEKLRASGDKDAIAIYNEYGGAAMNSFENLSDDQIKSIITYFKEWTPPAPKVAAGGEAATETTSFYSNNTLYILLFLIIVLVILLYVLNKTKRTLKSTVAEVEKSSDEAASAPSEFQEKIAYYKKRINPTIFKMAVGTVILGGLAAYGFYFGVTEVGVQQGYAPEQPIKYSHKLHAGELAIDCKYCHSTAEYSKQASVPSVNTCMNCHKGVQLRDKYNGEISPEIKKIYTAMDYDPDKPAGEQYGPNPKPIRWVRIHNLPDHAFFNHSMHVSTGVSCQTCHGPIQEMEVVQQFSTLQMGWCINCHRERNVDVENNPYYEKLHAKIKAEKNDKSSNYGKYFTKDGKINIKPADNGALECSKCHY